MSLSRMEWKLGVAAKFPTVTEIPHPRWREHHSIATVRSAPQHAHYTHKIHHVHKTHTKEDVLFARRPTIGAKTFLKEPLLVIIIIIHPSSHPHPHPSPSRWHTNITPTPRLHPSPTTTIINLGSYSERDSRQASSRSQASCRSVPLIIIVFFVLLSFVWKIPSHYDRPFFRVFMGALCESTKQRCYVISLCVMLCVENLCLCYLFPSYKSSVLQIVTT